MLFLETYQASTLCYLPMFHVSGINWITLQTLAVGGKMTILPGFNPQTFLDTLERTKVHCKSNSTLYATLCP